MIYLLQFRNVKVNVPTLPTIRLDVKLKVLNKLRGDGSTRHGVSILIIDLN